MSENPPDSWQPTYGSATYSTFTPTDNQTPLSPSRYTFTSRSDRPGEYDDRDSYTDDDSLDEVEATLNTIDDEITHTEHTLTQWSQERPYTPSSSYTGTGTYSGTYTGSTSYVTLPTVRDRTPQPPDPRIRLSRITERTEESRPISGSFSAAVSRPANPTPDALRRSTLLPGGTPSSGHSRSSTDPGGDRTLPPPGRATELIAVFESQGGSHSRFASAPGRSASPFPPSATHTTTGYGYGSTSYGYGSGSRPSSPSKSSGSSGSYTGTETRPTYSSMLSPPTRIPTSDYTRTDSYLTPSAYTQTPSTYTDTFTRTYTDTQTGTDTITGANTGTLNTASYTDTGSTFTPTTSTTLRRPQHSPRSPLASVKNLVTAWRERDSQPRPADDRPSGSAATSPPIDTKGLIGIGRRFRRAGARLRESGGLKPASDPLTPRRDSNGNNGNGDGTSIRSGRSGVLPPGFDLGQFSPYTQSDEAPLHIGLLWYLNVHAAPPYRWQRCQALLYPHMLLLSWLAPGGGRGIVALDLLNCTDVQQAYSPTHPNARDDIGTVAARIQSTETGGQPLMNMLVPFHMMYADGVERLAAESLLERQKWVNRILETVNRPVSDSQLTRSPTGSVRTILSIDSRSSSTSVGSRSTVFVPPLSSIPDIADYTSESSPLTRHLSFVSSHHTGTVDDTVIHNDRYIYPGDPRVIAPSRGNSLRRTGSMTDMDSEFNSALARARGARPSASNVRQLFEYSPVSVSSGSSLGKDIYVTPPPSTGRGSDRRSQISDEAFFSASSSGTRSNVASTYYSQTEWTGTMTGTGYDTNSGLRSDTFTRSSATHLTPSTLSYHSTDSASYLDDSRDDSVAFSGTSPSTLSRARAVTRRVRGGSRSETSTYTAESSDKENGVPSSSTYTPSGTMSQIYTPGTSTLTPGSRSHTIDNGSYTPGSETHSGSYTGTYTPSGQSGSYPPSSRAESYTASGSGSYTPGSGTGTYTASGSGSYTPSGSGSYTGSYTPGSGSGGGGGSGSGSGSYTPGSLTYGSGSYTPGSMAYSGTFTRDASSSSASNSFTRSTETGYDVCPSSDLTTLTRTTGSSYSDTLTPPARSVVSEGILDIPSKQRAVSQGSSGYLTAEEAPSTASSPVSFKSLSTIPPETEYVTADGASTTYKTASEPPTETEYHTASQMHTPSDHGVPQEIKEEPEPELPPEIVPLTPLSSLFDGGGPINIPTPSEIPSIRSPQSISDLLPEDVPLPPTLSSSPMPSFPSSSESLHVPTPSSMPIPTLPTEGRPLSSSDIELLSSLPATETSESESVLTPSSFERSSEEGTPRSRALPPIPRVESELAISTPSAPSSLSSSSEAPTPSSLPISAPSSLPSPTPQSTPWARETSLSYDSSVLQPSPSLRSIVVQDVPEASYDTSFLRPSASSASSVSSFDRLSTIPPSPPPSTSLEAASPLPSITPVPTLPPSDASQLDVTTPSSISLSTGTVSVVPSPVRLRVAVAPRTPSAVSSSFLSESELESSAFEYSTSLADTSEEELDAAEREVELSAAEGDDEFGSEPSTEPSLLSTPPASVRDRSGSATPIPVLPHEFPDVPSSPSPPRSEGSGAVSITTPEGSGRSPPGTLRTESSESVAVPRDIGRDLDFLADELRKYNDVRGDENRGLVDNLQALRHELRDLSEFLHRTPSPRQPIIIREGPQGVPQIIERHTRGPRVVEHPIIYERIPAAPSLMSQAIGSDNVMTEEIITMEGHIRDSTVTVARSSSNVSSVSFLSSHHSDDSLLEESEIYDPTVEDWAPSMEDQRRFVDVGDVESYGESEISTSSFTSSLETSSEETSTPTPTPESTATPSPVSPVSPAPVSVATTSSLSTPTIRPQPRLAEPSLDNLMDSLRGQLNDIRNQLNDLWNGQGSTNRMLDMLRSRPTPPPSDNAELNDRLHRIEDLMGDLIDQNRSRGQIPEPLPPLPVVESEPAESIITTSDSLGDLREQLEGFAPGRPPLRMPIPSQAMPSILQQLQESILSGLPSATANRPPPLQPFVFEPRQSRPRSSSPISLETLAPRPYTVPAIPDISFSDPRGVGAAATRPRHMMRPEDIESPSLSATDLYVSGPRGRFVMPRGDEPGRQFTGRPTTNIPPPRTIFQPDHGRAPTAPPDIGDRGWYRPAPPRRRQPQVTRLSQQPRAGDAPSTAPAPPSQPAHERVYIPMPPGPTQVQMPPVFESLLEILRENRLAQAATVEQQRELMRYMADLNNWLARDVRDRQAEIRGVNARVENLRRDLGTLAASRGLAGLSPTITSSSGSASPTVMTMPSTMAPIPMPQPIVYHPGPTPYAPGPQLGHPSTGVHPPVIPPEVTPLSGYQPVIPPVQPTPMGPQTVIIPPAPVIPADGYRPQPSRHATPLRPPRSPPTEPFIPIGIGSPESEPPVLIPPRTSIVIPGGSQSPSSSSTHSTRESYSPRGHQRRLSGRSRSSRSTRTHRHRDRSVSSGSSRSSRSRSPDRTPRGSRHRRSRSRTDTPRTHRTDGSYRPESRRHDPAEVIEQEVPRPAPPIHVVPVPPSSYGQTPMVAGSPRHPDLQLPQQQPPPTIIIQPSTQGQGQLPVMPTMPSQPHPAVLPMPQSVYGPGTVPIIISSRSSRSGSSRRRRSRRSRSWSRSRSGSPSRTTRSSGRRSRRRSRSRSRSRSHSRSPSRHQYIPPTPIPTVPSQPPILIETGRSRSRSRSYSPEHSHYAHETPVSHAAPVLVPSHPVQPPVIIQRPSRSRSSRSHSRRDRSRSRSRSHDRYGPQPGPVLIQPTGPVPIGGTLPTVIPQVPTVQPPFVVPSAGGPQVQPQFPQQPPIIIQSSRSRSRSPVTPITIPTMGAPSRGRSRSPTYHRRRSRSYSPHYHSPPHTTQIIPSRYPSHHSRRSRSHSPTILVTDPRVPRYPSSRRDYSPRDYSPRRRHSPSRTPSYHHYPSEYSSRRSRSRTPERHRRRPRSRTPERQRRRDRPRSRSPEEHPRYSRSPSRRHGRRRSITPDRYPRHDRPSPQYADSPSRRRSPRHGSPSRAPSLTYSHRSGSPIRHVLPPGARPIPRAGSSRPQSPIYVIPPSRTGSRISHRPPTVVGIDHPEDIHTHPREPYRTPPSRRTTSGRPSESGHYSPAHSEYEADDGRHAQVPPHPDQPMIPVIPSRASTSRHPHEGRMTPVPLTRRPSVSHLGPELPSSEHVAHEAPSDGHRVTGGESEIGHSLYETPLPVPPRRGPSSRRSLSPVSVVHPPLRHRSTTPIDLQDAEAERERHERLGAIERHLHDVALHAAQAEDEREAEFRRNEEHRERIFLENQERREEENHERTEHLWDTIQSRLQALPPPPLSDRPPSARPQTPRAPGTPIPEVLPETSRLPTEAEGLSADRASIASMKSVVERVASQHAEDILETVRLEREEFSREREAATVERERLMAEAGEAQRQLREEQESRISALEDELAAVKAELQNERQARLTEEADIRERERAEFAERDELLRAQLADITNLLQDNRDLTHQKKIDSDNRYAEKADRRQNKDIQVIELREMVQKIHDDLEAEMQRANEERIQALSKPSLDSIIEELQRQSAQQRELLQELSEEWRNDCQKHHLETLEAVRSTAQEQVPFNVQGYLDEFSKALAAEVRMLLGEVGKLREERRNLQHEMGFLLCMKSKYGPGGEFQPDWHPSGAAPPSEPPAPPPEAPAMPPDLPPPAVKPGWRHVVKRKGKKKDNAAQPPPPPPQAPRAPTHQIDPRRQVTQSWATWLPDPSQAPTPPSIEPSLTVPRAQSPGLFGPRTPSNKSWQEAV